MVHERDLGVAEQDEAVECRALDTLLIRAQMGNDVIANRGISTPALVLLVHHPRLTITSYYIQMSSSEHHSNTSPALEGHGPAALSNDARPTTDSDAGFHPAPPSETVQPTEVTTPTQQGMPHHENVSLKRILIYFPM